MSKAASTPSAAEVIARATVLASKLAERASESEALRRVPDTTIGDWLASVLH
jgi:hypothetical protein